MSKVSIVIPAYNCSQYITEAVESVMKQTYTDLEILVIDDGSKDNIKQVLDSYILRGDVKYIYQENQGPGAARNTGIKYATGKHIAFLDADDTFTENSIEKRMDLITYDLDVGLVFSNYYYQSKESQAEEINFQSDFFKNKSYYKMRTTPFGFVFDGQYKNIFEIPFKIHTGTVLVKKEVFIKSGFFRTDIFIAEDRDMWLRIANYFKLGYVNQPLAYYKRYRSSLTVNDPLKYGRDRITFHYNLMKIYKKDKNINTFLKKRLALIYYDIASYFYKGNQRMRSLENIMKCIFYNPTRIHYYEFFLSILFPKYLRIKLRKKR
jgi:glycosyltransferase involved in cell wall biosynthesis